SKLLYLFSEARAVCPGFFLSGDPASRLWKLWNNGGPNSPDRGACFSRSWGRVSVYRAAAVLGRSSFGTFQRVGYLVGQIISHRFCARGRAPSAVHLTDALPWN